MLICLFATWIILNDKKYQQTQYICILIELVCEYCLTVRSNLVLSIIRRRIQKHTHRKEATINCTLLLPCVLESTNAKSTEARSTNATTHCSQERCKTSRVLRVLYLLFTDHLQSKKKCKHKYPKKIAYNSMNGLFLAFTSMVRNSFPN
jgi:hypothetical protein